MDCFFPVKSTRTVLFILKSLLSDLSAKRLDQHRLCACVQYLLAFLIKSLKMIICPCVVANFYWCPMLSKHSPLVSPYVYLDG